MFFFCLLTLEKASFRGVVNINKKSCGLRQSCHIFP
jgi:hypothetical protein